MDAIKFLTSQHRQIESLFAQYERSPSKGREIFGQIERAIIPHAIIEEMYIYPMLRERAPGGAAPDAVAHDAGAAALGRRAVTARPSFVGG